MGASERRCGLWPTSARHRDSCPFLGRGGGLARRLCVAVLVIPSPPHPADLSGLRPRRGPCPCPPHRVPPSTAGALSTLLPPPRADADRSRTPTQTGRPMALSATLHRAGHGEGTAPGLPLARRSRATKAGGPCRGTRSGRNRHLAPASATIMAHLHVPSAGVLGGPSRILPRGLGCAG